MSIIITPSSEALSFVRGSTPPGIQKLTFTLENKGSSTLSLQLQLDVPGAYLSWVAGSESISGQVVTLSAGSSKDIGVEVNQQANLDAPFTVTLQAKDIDAVSSDESGWSASVRVQEAKATPPPKEEDDGKKIPPWVWAAVGGGLVLVGVVVATILLWPSGGVERLKVSPKSVELIEGSGTDVQYSAMDKTGNPVDGAKVSLDLDPKEGIVRIEPMKGGVRVFCIGVGDATLTLDPKGAEAETVAITCNKAVVLTLALQSTATSVQVDESAQVSVQVFEDGSPSMRRPQLAWRTDRILKLQDKSSARAKAVCTKEGKGRIAVSVRQQPDVSAQLEIDCFPKPAPAPKLSRIEIRAPITATKVDETVSFAAKGLDKDNADLPGFVPLWKSNKVGVAQVLSPTQATTQVRCVGLGNAEISAEAVNGEGQTIVSRQNLSCTHPTQALAVEAVNGAKVIVGEQKPVKAMLKGKLGTTVPMSNSYSVNWSANDPVAVQGSGKTVQARCLTGGKVKVKGQAVPHGGVVGLNHNKADVRITCTFGSEMTKSLRVFLSPQRLKLNVETGEEGVSSGSYVEVEYHQDGIRVYPKNGVTLRKLGKLTNNPTDFTGEILKSGFSNSSISNLTIGNYVAVKTPGDRYALIFVGIPMYTLHPTEMMGMLPAAASDIREFQPAPRVPRIPDEPLRFEPVGPADLHLPNTPFQWVLLKGKPLR